MTEDYHSSLQLHKAGFDTVYLNDPVAYGWAEADLNDFYKTRHRWAFGNLHALRLENALFCSGLTWRQRLSYLETGFIYLEGWQQLILFLVPVVSLLFGIPAFEITVTNVLVILLYPLLSYLLLQEMGCGFARFWANEIFSMARFPVHIAAWAALFKDKLIWRSSAKMRRGEITLPLIAPQLAVLVLSFAAVGFGVAKLSADFNTGPIWQAVVCAAPAWLVGSVSGCESVDWSAPLPKGYTVELVVVAGFFALMNALRAGLLIAKATYNARASRADYAFALPLPIELTGAKTPIRGVTETVSLSQTRFRLNRPLPMALQQDLHARLYLPSGHVDVDLAVVALEQGHVEALGEVRGATVEARFKWPERCQRDALSRALYSVDWQREILHRHAYFRTPLEVLKRLAIWSDGARQAPCSWSGVLYGSDGTGEPSRFAVLGMPRPVSDRQYLLAFEKLKEGSDVWLKQFDIRSDRPIAYRIEGEAQVQVLGRRGLDGSLFRKYVVTPIKPRESENLGSDRAIA